ncbi:DUF6121 family protein [Agromyces sp. LHK192]|uniref:DUF6121 family protein n=1 Tax=Agromyces sp. LHK192 TaxID=2498704 RepID=UPI000FD73151|nr:DUF6121 family protein [Agromyces sp. LHK192]
MDETRRNAWVVAGFAAALDLAVVVCAFGFVSLLADVDVVAEPEVGVLLAPVAVGASVLAVLLTLGVRLAHPERMALTVVLAAALSWLTLVVVATIGHLLTTTGAVLASVLFGLGFGVGWFGLLVPAAAAIVAVTAVLVARGRSGGMARPRWPWERDDDG